MMPPAEDSRNDDWIRFVLAHGFRARAHELAAVVQQPIEEVLRIRESGACAHLEHAKRFSELFSLWYGRAPLEGEWPTPRKAGSEQAYEWQGPELALLASLVGQISTIEIADVLTGRLRNVTADLSAVRTKNAVLIQMNKIGLQATDVVGGLTVAAAGREIGSTAILRHAIGQGELRTKRVGRLLVIPHDVWADWKAKRVEPPEGYIQLSTLREALGMRSDKLSEFAGMGYVPTAIRCNPYGAKGPSTKYGTWFVTPETAEKLIADRRAGRPMPWHGRPMRDNLKVTYKLWTSRQHPPECESCITIWGEEGAPADFDAYIKRYPDLAAGAKRHLTMVWHPGLTVAEVAASAGCSASHVRRAIESALLAATGHGDRLFITRADATRWIARKCPTGDSARSWITLATASKQYGFSLAELRQFIAAGTLMARDPDADVNGKDVFVGRHQVGQLRETCGYSLEEAARRAGVTAVRMRELLEGVQWRGTAAIPLSDIQAVIKRLESQQGYTLEEAARELGESVQWVKDRKDDGTIRVTVARWDRRRLYITEPMMERLREAQRNPNEIRQLPDDWMQLSDAALEAGVSPTTLMAWSESLELERIFWKGSWRYQQGAVRSRARQYWATVRFVRAVRPQWLEAEMAAGAAS